MKTHEFSYQNQRMEMIISHPELAVRMIEVLVGTQRPAGINPVQAMLDLKENAPDLYESAMGLAQAASDYFLECMAAAKEAPKL